MGVGVVDSGGGNSRKFGNRSLVRFSRHPPLDGTLQITLPSLNRNREILMALV